jgi:hypothetical protein
MSSHRRRPTNSICNSNREKRGNVTSDRLFPNRPKQLRPILATRDTLANPAEAIAPTYHHHHGKLRKFSRSGERTSSVLDAEAKSTSPTSLHSTDDRCCPNGTPPWPRAQAPENFKLNARSPSILQSHKTKLPLSVSNSTREA